MAIPGGRAKRGGTTPKLTLESPQQHGDNHGIGCYTSKPPPPELLDHRRQQYYERLVRLWAGGSH